MIYGNILTNNYEILRRLCKMQCKHCGAEVGSEYRLCPYCRTELEYPTQNQNNGGGQPTIIVQNVISNENAVSNRNNVGYAVRSVACSPKSKKLTLILAIALGFFGIHRFYVGKVGSGIVWLFTGGGFFFGYIYDIIKVLSGTFKDGNGLPVKK